MFAFRRLLGLMAVATVAAGLFASRVEASGELPSEEDYIRDGFETPGTTLQQEYTDATVRLLAHERSDLAAHGGRTSERFRFEAAQGNRFFVSRTMPKIPVTRELGMSLYVRSNQSGAQLFAWVVLPSDIDPESGAASFVLVPGPVFSRPDRWERLELKDFLPALEEQARALRASTRRPVSLEGAYLERVVVNLMGGLGQTDVFLDDLQVGPAPRELIAAWSSGTTPPARDRADAGPARAEDAAQPDAPLPHVRLSRGVLERLIPGRRYVPWFPTAIDAPGADPGTLRQYGFDVLVTGPDPDVKRIQPVLEGDRPMCLLPRIGDATAGDGPQQVLRAISEYPMPDAVMLWSIGEHLGRERHSADRVGGVRKVREVLTTLHEANDVHRLATATVDGEWRLYTRTPSNLDVVGIDLPIWGRSQSFLDGVTFLKQRRDLVARTNLEALFWAWLPSATPALVTRNIWGTDEVPPWGTPTIQSEQLRLSTYMAMAGGCRGLTFVGDADLTRPSGEPLLIEMGFLNAEIDLFEAILAGNIGRVTDYPVFDPDPAVRPTIPNVNQKRLPLIKESGGKPGMLATAIPLADSKGALILVADFSPGGDAQWQPSQLAHHDLIISARLPQAVQFLEVNPGEARFLEPRPDDRRPGGTRVTVPDFGVTTMILATTDMELCERVQRDVMSIRPTAAQWAIRQAEIQLATARDGHERLKADGHLLNNDKDLEKRRSRGIEGEPTDADDLLARAGDFIKAARTAFEAQDYSTAWAEARRASRPLRLVMYGYWAEAMLEFREAVQESLYGEKKEYPDGAIRPYPDLPLIITAASCPPAVSFQTLPQLHIWKDWIRGMPGYRFGENRIPSGSFDDEQEVLDAGWTDVSHEYDGVVKKINVPPRIARKAAQPKETKKRSPYQRKKNAIRYADEWIAPGDHVLKMAVAPSDPKKIDEIDPYLDEPAAAVLSPPFQVGANNLIRISVVVKQPVAALPGKGGVVIRDTIGGEPYQMRLQGPIPAYSRIVLYRKAPTDGKARVLLGLAGFGEVEFDDLRVEIIEEDGAYQYDDPETARDRRPGRTSPRTPDPRTPSAAAAAVPPESRRER